MFLLNDTPLGLDTAFVHGEISYPANWLRLASPEERAAIGISEADDPAVYDDRFYWGVGNPKDIEQVKAMLIAQVKQAAASLLAPTDWKVIRAAETGGAVDTATLANRTDVRSASNVNEAAITAATTVDEMASISFTWPP